MQPNLPLTSTPEWQPVPEAWGEPPRQPVETVWEHTTPPPPMNETDFSNAFRHGYPMTLRFLLSRGARTETAEEIAQAAWAKGWECRRQLQRPHMIGAWVNSIAKNMLKNRVRADQKLEGLSEYANSGGPFLLSVDVKRILNRCDQRDSKILTGYYLEGYTSEEIAQQVGLTPVAVRVRLLRIRRALRSQFAKPTPNLAGMAGAA